MENPLPNPTPQPTPKQFNKKLFAGAAGFVVLLIIAGLYLIFRPHQPVPVPQTEQNPQDQSLGQVQNDQPKVQIPNPELEKLSNYSNVIQSYGVFLTAAQQKYLLANHFILLNQAETSFQNSGNFDQMLVDFDSIGGSGSIYYRAPENSKLVTPDVVLEAYHKFFENTLELLEQNELGQNLGEFITNLQSNLAAAAKNSTGDVQTRYQNLNAQIILARVLFENKSPAKPDSFASPDEENAYLEKDKSIDSFDNAKKILSKYSAGLPAGLVSAIQTDLQKIYAASDVGKSPLFSQYSDTLQTDYTQFTPRSHYTKNSQLRAYFRTMMLLGRSSYFLQKDVGIQDTNLLVKQMGQKSSGGIVPLDDWNKIMAVTGYYAGQSDDLTYTEWSAFENQILGSSNLSDADLISQDNVNKLAQNLDKLRLPQILSDVVVDPNIKNQNKADLLRKSLSFRVFGQRFTFDAWILNNLTSGEEQSNYKLPSMPSALFVPAALGDTTAQKHSEEFLQKDAGFSASDVNSFNTKLSQVQSDVTKIKHDEWFADMGRAWLYVLGSLTHTYDKTYPAYMQAPAFLDKQIQTFLGSYTELKHDTLLYAKQSYAERGGGGGDSPIPPVVKGYVEPNMDFWNRFSQLVSNTQNVFATNHLLQNSSASERLKNFSDIVAFYKKLAQAETDGKAISDDDYEKLRTTGLAFMADPFDAGVDPTIDTSKVAMIAEIHTDGVKEKVLYEAVAEPYYMLSIVDNEKTPRITLSPVYNHYEFTGALGGKRLTDEDWKSWVYDDPSKLPAKNFWYDSLTAK